MNDHYDHFDDAPLDIPVTAFAGIEDAYATPELVGSWSAHTSRAFVLHRLLGGHFAVLDHAVEDHRFIAATLDAG